MCSPFFSFLFSILCNRQIHGDLHYGFPVLNNVTNKGLMLMLRTLKYPIVIVDRETFTCMNAHSCPPTCTTNGFLLQFTNPTFFSLLLNTNPTFLIKLTSFIMDTESLVPTARKGLYVFVEYVGYLYECACDLYREFWLV